MECYGQITTRKILSTPSRIRGQRQYVKKYVNSLFLAVSFTFSLINSFIIILFLSNRCCPEILTHLGNNKGKQSAGFAEAYSWQQEQRNLLSTLYITCKTPFRICKPSMVTLPCQRQTGHWKHTMKSIKNCPGQNWCEMSYEERCELLGWSTLQCRREYFSLVECYKTVFELNRL